MIDIIDIDVSNDLIVQCAQYQLVMEQHSLKNVNSCWNTKVTFHIETFGGQYSNYEEHVLLVSSQIYY